LRHLDAAGKPTNLALVACMHKLLTILNDIVRHDDLWQVASMPAT
jgi:hypothetical protein